MTPAAALLEAAAGMFPGRIAAADRRQALTYRQLHSLCLRAAGGLRQLGIRQGDRVAFLMKNSVEWVAAWYACLYLGAIVVPLHTRLCPQELLQVLTVSRCSALVLDAGFSDTLAYFRAQGLALAHTVCTGGQISSAAAWAQLTAGRGAPVPPADGGDDAPAMILYTSGTTGTPKGVVRRQEDLVRHGQMLAAQNNAPGRRDVMLSTSPLHHIGGLQGLLKMSVLAGTYVTMDRIKPEEILRSIQEYRVTQLQMLPPVTYERLYRSGAWRDWDCSCVWEVCISAGKCTTEYTDHIFRMFPNAHLRPSWGSTEAGTISCAQMTREDLADSPARIQSVGRLIPGVQLRIVGQNGAEVRPGLPGEALVRSPLVFDGYLDDPDHTAAAFTPDGWYRTGDIVSMNPEDGCLYFLDRREGLIKTGGENVFALEVERIIQKHPDVQECAVIGVPDPRFGEAIAAAVVCNPGRTISPEELVRFCCQRMSSYKKPRYIAFLDQLPVNDVGKVQKSLLRDRWRTMFRPVPVASGAVPAESKQGR